MSISIFQKHFQSQIDRSDVGTSLLVKDVYLAEEMGEIRLMYVLDDANGREFELVSPGVYWTDDDSSENPECVERIACIFFDDDMKRARAELKRANL